jgi:hypothetical protein
VTDKQVERISGDGFSGHMENVARGTETLVAEEHLMFVFFQQSELMPLIEQRHIHASLVGRTGDHILIPFAPERRPHG